MTEKTCRECGSTSLVTQVQEGMSGPVRMLVCNICGNKQFNPGSEPKAPESKEPATVDQWRHRGPMTNLADSQDSPACWVRREEVVCVREKQRTKLVDPTPSAPSGTKTLRLKEVPIDEWIIHIEMKSGAGHTFVAERRASDFMELLFP